MVNNNQLPLDVYLSNAISACLVLTELKNSGPNEFYSREVVERGAAQAIEQVGESYVGIKKWYPEVEQFLVEEFDRFVAVPKMRQIIAHVYHTLDKDIVWSIVERSSEDLLASLRAAEGRFC